MIRYFKALVAAGMTLAGNPQDALSQAHAAERPAGDTYPPAAPDPGWLPTAPDAPPPSVDYAWPVMGAIDGATLLVDAGADFPAELSRLTVRIRGAGAEDAAALSAALAGASKVVIRNPRFGVPDCECQVVVDGDSLGGR